MAEPVVPSDVVAVLALLERNRPAIEAALDSYMRQRAAINDALNAWFERNRDQILAVRKAINAHNMRFTRQAAAYYERNRATIDEAMRAAARGGEALTRAAEYISDRQVEISRALAAPLLVLAESREALNNALRTELVSLGTVLENVDLQLPEATPADLEAISELDLPAPPAEYSAWLIEQLGALGPAQRRGLKLKLAYVVSGLLFYVCTLAEVGHADPETATGTLLLALLGLYYEVLNAIDDLEADADASE
jgi:hypothetical protein